MTVQFHLHLVIFALIDWLGDWLISMTLKTAYGYLCQEVSEPYWYLHFCSCFLHVFFLFFGYSFCFLGDATLSNTLLKILIWLSEDFRSFLWNDLIHGPREKMFCSMGHLHFFSKETPTGWLNKAFIFFMQLKITIHWKRNYINAKSVMIFRWGFN